MTVTGRIDTPKSHYYKIDGEKTPGVTTILGAGVPTPALVYWAANGIAGYVSERLTPGENGTIDATQLDRDLRTIDATTGRAPKFRDGFTRNAIFETLKGVHWLDRDQAANKGTEIHGYAERLINGEECDIPHELEGHVDSFIRWHEDWQPRNTLPELVVGSRRHNYMGTTDLVADLADDRRWLVDYKTGRSGVYPETALQCAAYRYAEFAIINGVEAPMPEVDAVGVVWLRADGYDFYPLTADEHAFRTFLYAQQIARFAAADRSEYIGDALTPPQRQEAA